MVTDRYLKVVLTVIALELGWLGLKDVGPTVEAQAQPTPTPVIIRGINVAGPESGYLPVAVVGSYRRVPAAGRETVGPLTTEVTTERAIRVETDRPLDVTVQGPVKVEAERPLRVENVQAPLQRRPGE